VLPFQGKLKRSEGGLGVARRALAPAAFSWLPIAV